jgi:Right handed beta helix region
MNKAPKYRLILSLLLLPTVFSMQNAMAAPLELTVTPNNAAGFIQTLSKVKAFRSEGNDKKIVLVIPAGLYQFEQTVQLSPEIVGQGLTLVAKKDHDRKAKPTKADDVIFSGGVRLPAGRRDAKGNWRYALPIGWNKEVAPRVILIDDALQSAARFPNEGFLRIEKSLPDRRSGFITKEGDLPKGFNPSNGVCDLVFLHDWSSSRLPVASYDSTSRQLRSLGPIGCAAKHYAIDHFEQQPRYWLEGHADFADLPGEWHLDLQAGEIVVVSGEADQQAPNVSLPRLTEILAAEGTEENLLTGLTLQGITFTGTMLPMPAGGLAAAQATMFEPRNAKGERTKHARSFLEAAVKIERATHCQVVSCRFQDLGGSGLWLGGQTLHCEIRQCKVRNVGGNGINLGEDRNRLVDGKTWFQSAPNQVPQSNRVYQCEVSLCGRVLPGAVGIWASLQKKLEISKCFLHDLPYTGISLGWIWNDSPSPASENVVRDNRIEFVMQTLSDGGGIYTLGRQPGSILENNTISDLPLNAGRAESNGMFLDEGTSGFIIRNNTIRRVAKSPLRFNRPAENIVTGNRWELRTVQTPPVRIGGAPETLITVKNNTLLEKQKQLYFIGNSLTWDTLPPRLDERILYHIDCGKPLKYIYDHPENPCIAASRIWPLALKTTQFDFISFQPHYGKSLEEDFETISKWIDMQHTATIIIHTGWARSAQLVEEWADTDPNGPPTHSLAYINELINRLSQKYPTRKFRSSFAMNYLHKIEQDIQAGKAPFQAIEELYRDPIHMKTETGRYMMHNAIRKAIGQPVTDSGFPEIAPEVKEYLDRILETDFE